MRNIKVRFESSCFPIYIYIYNEMGDCVVEDVVEEYQNNYCLEMNQVYRMIAYTSNQKLRTNFYVDSTTDMYSFSFHHLITFQITDFYYKNLPIQKGEIILWNKIL